MPPARGDSPRLYGRRKGKRLRPGQEALLARGLAALGLALPPDGERLEPRRLFAFAPDAVWLEIGFGGGEHLAALAAAHPAIGFIGCEPYVNGIAKLLARADAAALANLRVFPDDARLLLPRLAPASLGRVFILFPDPWPKTRHHRRRFVQAANLTLLADAMADGAELRLATDDAAYADAMRDALAGHPAFAALPLASDAPPDQGLRTRYEEKALKAGREPEHLAYRRRPRG